MMIIQCKQCGQYLHATNRCFFCGNKSEFLPVGVPSDVHENVKEEFEKLPLLVKNKKFSEALSLADHVLEWSPHNSDAFWCRLLAKNKCCNDEELIKQGFFYEHSGDYQNALLNADTNRQKVYEAVIRKMTELQAALMQGAAQERLNRINMFSIKEMQADLHSIIESSRKDLFSLWTELKGIESKMKELEGCYLLNISEHTDLLTKVNSEAKALEQNVKNLHECTESEAYEYQLRFVDLKSRSESAKRAIISHNSSFKKSYEELDKQRLDVLARIDKIIEMMNLYENVVKSAVNVVDTSEEMYEIDMMKLRQFDLCLVNEELTATIKAKTFLK